MADTTTRSRRRILSDEWLGWDPQTIAWYPEQVEPPESEPVLEPVPEPGLVPDSGTDPLIETGVTRTRAKWLAIEAFYFILGGFLTGVVTAMVLAAIVLLL